MSYNTITFLIISYVYLYSSVLLLYVCTSKLHCSVEHGCPALLSGRLSHVSSFGRQNHTAELLVSCYGRAWGGTDVSSWHWDEHTATASEHAVRVGVGLDPPHTQVYETYKNIIKNNQCKPRIIKWIRAQRYKRIYAS